MGNTHATPGLGLRFETRPEPIFQVPAPVQIGTDPVQAVVHPAPIPRRAPGVFAPVAPRAIVSRVPYYRQRRRYTPNERREAVNMVTEMGMSYRQAAIRTGLRCSW